MTEWTVFLSAVGGVTLVLAAYSLANMAAMAREERRHQEMIRKYLKEEK